LSDSKREQQASRLAAVTERRSAETSSVLWLLEDSPLQAERTRRALRDQHVVHFTDGISLLEELSRSSPEVMVLDWELPGLSGLEVLRFIREARDEVTLPVLVLTSSEPAMLEALAAGANDFATKPCPDVVLRARVHTLLRIQALAARSRVAEQERTDALERVYEAETRMHVALEAANLGTWELDPRTGVLQLDGGSQALMGLPGVVTQSEAQASIHPDDRERVHEALSAALDPARRTPYAVEYRVQGSGEREQWNAAWALPFFEGSEPVRLIGAVLDVTERKQASAIMERDAAFRERFIAILAHDLRTPLTALGIGSQLLARRTVDEVTARNLGARIAATTKRMERMVADLLDFTRSRQGGGMPVTLADTDLEAICRSVVQEVELGAPGRKIAFECLGEMHGQWDAGRLQQVVSNLVSNAVDYSPESSLINVTLRADQAAVILSVQNGGAVIPRATLHSLFDPFRRGSSESTASRGSRGLGLGLYIVDQIARAHRGSVNASSDAETGTTFSVVLPRGC
jgi:phosphoserine phosphatase RsbU/P